MNVANNWKDYEILDMANGQKLEKWGNIILSRPDPQIIWKEKTFPEKWKNVNATYHRSKTGGGSWEYNKKVPEQWQIKYKELTFNIKPMGFKHTGLFPEQAVNWDWMIQKIKNSKREIKVLNLFAYTGGATVACSYAGASVCHVDSSKGMVSWAKENATSSGLSERPVRYIVDDVVKFVNREIRRGNEYDAIIMDPPSYGRGANGEVWQFENNIYDLVELCTKVLSEQPLFFLINSYTTGISSKVLENILYLTVSKKYKGNVYLALQSYNYGRGLVDSIICIYADEIGSTYDNVVANFNDFGWMKYVKMAHNNPQSFAKMIDTNKYPEFQITADYLNKWSYDTYGDENYVSNVLSYYIGTYGKDQINDKIIEINYLTNEVVKTPVTEVENTYKF